MSVEVVAGAQQPPESRAALSYVWGRNQAPPGTLKPDMTEGGIRDLFRQRFSGEPAVVAVAPGRVNLIGEHTDYNDGFVFPAAIDRLTVIAAAPTDGPTQLHSEQTHSGEPFDAATVKPGGVQGWSRYPAGMAWALRGAGCDVVNLQAVVASDIPMGSGVSSSAALEMAFGVIWRAIGKLEVGQSELAQIGKICENKFVGVNSGIMDQMASAMGRDGKAMFLDTRSLEIEYASIPEELVMVICDTKKERALTDSAYNERRSQCEEASRLLGVRALRDATLDMLESHRSQMSDVVYRRAKHVITEDERAKEFRTALDSADRTAIGALMKASHESLRDDYEVSCSELDWMAEAAWRAPGCVGARMTGAGFGGACIALVEDQQIEGFKAATLGGFISAGGRRDAEALPCRAVQGAHILSK